MTGDGSPIQRTELSLDASEIVAYDLGRAKRGYDRSQVDELLDRLAAQTEGLVREVEALRADREVLLARLDTTSEAEATLKKTLVTAQRAAEISVQEAQEQASAIRDRALERAEDLLRKAADQAQELRDTAMRRARADEADARHRRRLLDEHVAQLRAFTEDHRERVGHHLRQQLERLEAMDVPTPPPAAPTTDDDRTLADATPHISVDELVADIARAVPAPVPPPAGGPGAPGVDGDTQVHAVAPPSAPPLRQPQGPPLAPTQQVEVEDLLARVDQAAAEVEDTSGVLRDPPPPPPA